MCLFSFLLDMKRKRKFILKLFRTAKSLAFAIILLAQHPEVQEKARKEIQEQLGNKKCDYESSSKLKYLSMIIKEGMRLYSPVVWANRVTTKETTLGGFKIPKNQLVQVSITAIHHVGLNYYSNYSIVI